MTELERGWLAGIIEGEGCFYIRRLGDAYHGSLDIVNTNPKIIHKIGRILDKLGVVFSLRHRTPERNCKPYSQLTVQRVEDVYRLLKAIQFDIECRQEQLSVLLEYVSIRMAKGRGIKYGTVEIACHDRLKELNKRGK